MEKLTIYPSPNIYTALRGAGYNSSYAAIMECIDNAMENEVGATKISVTVDYDERINKITRIYIADNGESMDEDAANRFFSLGNSKKSHSSFGKYGMGGKTGCLSIGSRLEVFTKIKNGNVEKRVLDINEIVKNNEFIIPFYSEKIEGDINKNEIHTFYEKIGDNHGTLIIIENIDKLDTHQLSYINVKNKYYTPLKSFDQKLISEIAETHSKNIANGHKKIFVCGQEVKPINYFGGKSNGKEFTADCVGTLETNIDDCNVRCEVYDCAVGNGINTDDYDLTANALNSGALVFRNGRLVGKGLTFDLISINKGDGHATNVRYSIEVSGKADKLVNSSFIKSVNSGDAFDERLKLFLQNEVNQLIKKAKELKKERSDINKDKKLEEDSKSITKSVKNLLKKNPLKVKTSVSKNKKKYDEAQKNGANEINKTPFNNRTDLSHNKIDNSNWLHGIKLSNNYLKDDDIFYFQINPQNGKYELILNVNHPFYEQFISKLDSEQTSMFLLFEMVQRLSILNNDKISSDDKNVLLEMQNRIDEYRIDMQNAVFNRHKSINKNIAESILKSKNCIGVGISSEDIGITISDEQELVMAESAV
jgi:hypothetical protein